MYIVIKSLNKTLGKYIEMKDLYIGLPIFLLFLILFSVDFLRGLSFVILSVGCFMLIPINVSKKNRVYKIFGLLFNYIKRPKDFYFENERLYEKKQKR